MLSYQYPERKRKSPSCSAPVLKLTYLIDSNCTWMMVFLTVGTCNNHSIFKKEERRGEGIFNLFWFWVWLGLINQILFGWHLVILMLGTIYLVTKKEYLPLKCFISFLHQIKTKVHASKEKTLIVLGRSPWISYEGFSGIFNNVKMLDEVTLDSITKQLITVHFLYTSLWQSGCPSSRILNNMTFSSPLLYNLI